ncbi:MAG: response regulator [Sulfuricurvum sp.]|nr:response regulator [Sulfuricurvum sp.]MDP3023546.1 response regulator [Sulfuricurvum sp.]MDP3118881.1 response regulator [Sulfuricurvum sp.]
MNELKIISVDDTYINLVIIEEMASDIGIEVISFQNPLDALEHIKTQRVDMMLADYMMPQLDGLELIKEALSIQEELIPIMVTAVSDNNELKLEALNIGAADFLTKPVNLAEFKAKIKNFSKIIQLKLDLKDFNGRLQEEVKKATSDLVEREHEALRIISRLAEYRDPETGSHIARVAHYSKLLAKEYGLDEREQDIIFFASPLHDVGKVAIRDNILLKPAKLEADEYEIMQTHASIGYEILKESKNPYLVAGAIIAKHHHEKYDGTGYHTGIRGEEIHIYGRITAIADVFDALTSQRPYKKPWTFEDATEFLKQESGKHFDPKLVELFTQNIQKIKEIYLKFEE